MLFVEKNSNKENASEQLKSRDKIRTVHSQLSVVSCINALIFNIQLNSHEQRTTDYGLRTVLTLSIAITLCLNPIFSQNPVLPLPARSTHVIDVSPPTS